MLMDLPHNSYQDQHDPIPQPMFRTLTMSNEYDYIDHNKPRCISSEQKNEFAFTKCEAYNVFTNEHVEDGGSQDGEQTQDGGETQDRDPPVTGSTRANITFPREPETAQEGFYENDLPPLPPLPLSSRTSVNQ